MKQFVAMMSLLLFLLIFHKETISGTETGLLLWYQTLVPSLLPFILITNALSETNSYQAASHYLQKYFSPRIYECMAIVLGNLCGYPIGGKIINDFVQNQYLSGSKANQLLALASQASPMFLLGYIHLHIIKNSIPLSIFLLSIYLPVIIGYAILSRKENTYQNYTFFPSQNTVHICDTFLHAVQIMVMIGIYVILFSILLNILLLYCHSTPSRLLLSFLEITTGLKLLDSLCLSAPLKTALICALSSFGGMCSAFQIKSVLNYPEANIKKYLHDKFLLSTGTFLIIYFYLKFHSSAEVFN